MKMTVIAKKTIQEHIDEQPIWADGTLAPPAPLTTMQRYVWCLVAFGKLLEGSVIFMAGIAMPLLSYQFELNATQTGLISAACPFGVLVGAVGLGHVSDRFGRKPVFIAEMVIFVVSLIIVTTSLDLFFLLLGLFGLGLAIGSDAPVATAILAENFPSKTRGWIIVSSSACATLGIVVGMGIGLSILSFRIEASDWRLMYGVLIIPAILSLTGRFFIPASGQWLASKGRMSDATKAIESLLKRTPKYPPKLVLSLPTHEHNHASSSHNKFFTLFSKKYRRATILASVPWFLLDISIFGIGIFTPTILALTFGAKNPHARNIAEIISNETLGVKGALFVDLFSILGMLLAIFLITRVSRIKLQTIGFILAGVGLFLAATSLSFEGTTKTLLMLGGLIIFTLMAHLGPVSMSHVLASEVFPIQIRGAGLGFAAAFAKSGAVLASFLFPIVLKDFGLTPLLYGLVVITFLGAAITWFFRIQTDNVSLEKLHHE